MINDTTPEERVGERLDIKNINTSTYQKTDEEYMVDLNSIGFVSWAKQQIGESNDGKIRFKVKDVKDHMGNDYKLISDYDFYTSIKRIFDGVWANENFVINMDEHIDGDKIFVVTLDYLPIKIITTKDVSKYTFENPNPNWKNIARKWVDFTSSIFENWAIIESSDINPKYERYPVACLPTINLNTDFVSQQSYREYAWRAESSLIQKIYINKIIPGRCEKVGGGMGEASNGKPANIYVDNSGGFQITGSVEGSVEVESVYSGVTVRKLLTDEFSILFWNRPIEYRKTSLNMIYNLLMIADQIYEPPNN